MAIDDNLGVDLYELLKAGKENYPSVALQYSIAVNALDATERGLAAAFRRPDVFGGGTFGVVHDYWRDLRDQVADALNQTRSSLEDTGAVLCMAVAVYEKTDAEAAESLRAVVADRGDPGITI
ncbi:MAG TPA: hypothetical protein VN408_01495 [Actinoplanes sp.]|nr:hypothetical protein [Actinoplanes sp.]